VLRCSVDVNEQRSRKRLTCGYALVLAALAWNALAEPSFAEPPRILEDVAPAGFEEPAALEPPRLISPRGKSEGVTRKGPAAKKQSTPVSIWGTVAGLVAVFGIFLGARVWLTKHGPPGFRGLPPEALELLGKRAIEPRMSVHLVRCGAKILMLGVGPDGIRTLTEITDPVEVDLLAGACRRKAADKMTAPFDAVFRRNQAATPAREEA
jgi:flagellar biogenesis protein FliO